MSNTSKAYLAGITQAIIIGLSFLFIKMSLEVTMPLDILAHRFSVAFIGATLFLWLFKTKITITLKEVLSLSLIAIFYPTFLFLFQVLALYYTSSSEAGIIQAITPITTMIFAFLILREYVNFKQIIAILLSVVGVIFIFFMKGTDPLSLNIIGSVFMLFSTISSSMYNVLVRKYSQKITVFTITYVMIIYGFVIFNATSIINHLLNDNIDTYFSPFLDMKFVIAIIYLGILSTLVTSFLSNYALSKIKASQVSVFANVSTLITILAGIFILKEAFYWYHFLGGILIIGGAFLANFYSHTKVD